MKPYPLMMNLDGKPVIVVGGGKVALRKIKSLLECGACVTVIAPDLETEQARMARERKIEWIEEEFEVSLLDDLPKPILIFGTTNDRKVNVRIHEAAVERGIPCNIADVPDLCTFTVPAVADRGDLIIAVSTGGTSPALSRRIREQLEELYGPEYASLTRVLGELRKEVLRLGRSSDDNKELFLKVVDSDLIEAVRTQDPEEAVAVLRSLIPDGIDAATVVARSMNAQTRDQ